MAITTVGKTSCEPDRASGYHIARKKILFVGEGISLAHVTRPMVLAGCLDPSRYAIRFACNTRYADLPAEAGFPVDDLYTLCADEFFSNLEQGRPGYTIETLRKYVEAELALLEDVMPDLVVGDFRLSLGTSCRVKGIPYVSLVNAYWSPHYKLSFPIPDVPVTRFLGQGLSRLVVPLAMPFALRQQASPYNRIRREYGLPAQGGLRDVYTDGDWTFYLDLPRLAPLGRIPETHRLLGPVLWEPQVKEMPSWWDQLEIGQRTAYVSMGSSGAGAVVPKIIGALHALGCQAVVTTGQELPFGEHDGVFSARLLPGAKATARCDVVVCHGGSGTVYQALQQGVPVLGICANADQQLVMQGVKSAGAGRSLMLRQATVESVKEAVREILEDPAYANAAQALSNEMKRSRTAERFVRWIGEICRVKTRWADSGSAVRITG